MFPTTDRPPHHPPNRPPHPAIRLWRASAAWLDRLLKLVVCLLLLAMMGLTFVDVIGRYGFGHSIPGSFELTQVLLALLIFAGLPLVSAPGDHVTVTLVTDVLPPTLRRWLAMLTQIAAAGAVGLIGWRLWLRADRMLLHNDTTMFLRLPLGPVAKLLAALALIAAALMLLRALQLLRTPIETVPASGRP